MLRLDLCKPTRCLIVAISLLTACNRTSSGIADVSLCTLSEVSNKLNQKLPSELVSISSLYLDNNAVRVIGWQSNDYVQTQEFRGYNISPIRLEIDLNAASITASKTPVATAIRAPCKGECLLDLVDESPNKKWQLIQVRSSDKLVAGVWLVSQTTSSHLWNVIPGSSSWQWSNQSDGLLYKHSLEGFGIRSLLFSLSEDSIKESTELKGLANSSFNHVILNEVTGGLASSSFISTTEQLTFLQFLNGQIQTSSTQTIAGIQAPIWSHELDEIYVLKEDKGGQLLVGLSSGKIFALPTTPSIARSIISISPTGKTVFVFNNYTKNLAVFGCVK